MKLGFPNSLRESSILHPSLFYTLSDRECVLPVPQKGKEGDHPERVNEGVLI